eukprot:gene6270-6508_t
MAAKTKSSVVPPPLQRLPLYEMGLRQLPAIPLLQPDRFVTPTNLEYQDVRQYMEQLFGSNFPYLPKNVTICSVDLPQGCATLNMGSVMSKATGCIREQGWIYAGAKPQACPFAKRINRASTNITLQDPKLVSGI